MSDSNFLIEQSRELRAVAHETVLASREAVERAAVTIATSQELLRQEDEQAAASADRDGTDPSPSPERFASGAARGC